MNRLLLAAASVDVTPPPGHRLDGYAIDDRQATGTADPLRVTLFHLRTPDDPGIAWLCVDALAVEAAWARRLAEAVPGVPAERVIVCASHTHSGPAGWSGCIHPLLPARSEESLRRQLLEAASRLRPEPVPVDGSWFEAEVSGVGTNRHDPTGPHDKTVGGLVLRGSDGAVAGLLFDYACHPTVLGPESTLWSADWPGATRALLADAGIPVVSFLQGAAGDVSPRFVRQGRDVSEVKRLGGTMANTLRTLIDTATPLRPGPLRLHRATVKLPVRRLPPRDEVTRTLSDARRAVAAVGDGHGGPSLRLAQSRLEGARGLASLLEADLPAAMTLSISIVTLGERVAWVHLPVEPFTRLAWRIKQDSPFPSTRVIGCADGYLGYAADRRAHESGTYEALMSYFDAEATEALADRAGRLLRNLGAS